MEKFFSDLLGFLDPFLVQLFLATSEPLVNFFLGCFALAMICVVFGELALSLAIRFNREQIENLKREIREKEALSIQAYELGDMTSYHGLNRDANEAWGRHFFTMAAYSAGVLWPVPFALAWMQIHFAAVELPLAYPLSLIFGDTVGYPFCFIPIYVLCRILFKYLHPFLPYFRNVHKILGPTPEKDAAKPAAQDTRQQ